jgi:hypothetical protein
MSNPISQLWEKLYTFTWYTFVFITMVWSLWYIYKSNKKEMYFSSGCEAVGVIFLLLPKYYIWLDVSYNVEEHQCLVNKYNHVLFLFKWVFQSNLEESWGVFPTEVILAWGVSAKIHNWAGEAAVLLSYKGTVCHYQCTFSVWQAHVYVSILHILLLYLMRQLTY